ncbi:MAG: flagellar export chaperone FlgN [Balneolales bacterium]|nr:flagellar export chaperone FlgN [Balneolales bacterium]
MSEIKEMPQEIQTLAEKVESLHESSKKMIEVMECQIEAIIASNSQKIEELSGIHATLTMKYSDQEREFIEELQALLSDKKSEKGIRLIDLKELFPESALHIDNWQKLLNYNLNKLQRKHNQIVELLEFAMSSNAKMMHALYSKHNEKNTLYNAAGSRSNISPGVAVNHEI